MGPKERRILKNSIKHIADDLNMDTWNNPYEDICMLHKELVRNTLCRFILGCFCLYSFVGFIVLAKKIFRSDNTHIHL